MSLLDIRSTFLEAAETARPLLAHPRVGDRWESPSALAEMTIGELAGHLVRATTSVRAYLDREKPMDHVETLDAPGYYLSISGLADDIDSPLHRAIRDRASKEAEGGHVQLMARWDEAIGRLRSQLPAQPPGRRVAALKGRAIPLDEYLVTRLVELVVHSDDLAVSIDGDFPGFATEATDAVIGCLMEMARRRHGDRAVIGALTRRERDAAEALRVL